MGTYEENLPQQTLRRLWKRYGLLFLALAIAIIVIASYKQWTLYKIKQEDIKASIPYSQSLNKDNLQNIIQKYPNSHYATWARLRLASMAHTGKETAQAINYLNQVLSHDSDPVITHIAQIRLASMLIDNHKPKEALKYLPIQTQTSWYPIYLKAYALYQTGQFKASAQLMHILETQIPPGIIKGFILDQAQKLDPSIKHASKEHE